MSDGKEPRHDAGPESGAPDESGTREGAERDGSAEPDEPVERDEPTAGRDEPDEPADPDEPVERAEGTGPVEESGLAEGVRPVAVRGPVRASGPAGLNGKEQAKHTHAGNRTVNHGPADQGPDTRGPEGLGSDELALRTMLHHAVQDVEPSDGTLEHLRRAVPARRARKRQAVVGVAAAVLFVGTAIPALVHVSNTTGPGADPSVAGHASQAQGGASQGKDPAGGQSGVAGSAGAAEDKDKADPKGETPRDEESGAATGSAPGADPSASTAAEGGAPACTAQQLGPAVASSAAPDSTGVVYGSFQVTNVSSDGCTVVGPGSVVATPQGAAEATRIGTARHAAGDAAAGLPDPSLEAASLALAPGSAYEVQFAWVPSETCPAPGDTTGGGTGGPTPAPSPTEAPTTAGGTSAGDGDTGTTTQLVTEDGPAGGSVSVTYTPEGGAGSATATVSDACAGTVYWTGVLPGPA
ncbi:hypothetical protein [Streptomyces sp. NPDC059459]|uniref:hypothetical protein n=1 Tax=unclassified Streptomyces TaxID=2593676 RepID=UPI0036C39696